MSELLPRVFGPYLLLTRLGEGGAGAAYLARPLDPARGVPSPMVIKRMHARLSVSAEYVKRFRHEAELAVRVDSPHVARVFDAGSASGELYIAIEYVVGWTAAEVLAVVPELEEPLPVGVAVETVAQALVGLEALHGLKDEAGRSLEVVHRDLSSKNVMLGDDGRVRLIDLGLGKSRAQDWQTEAGRVMGSPGYMAPEQIKGQPATQQSDVYSLGVLLFELLVGQRRVALGPSVQMLREAYKKSLVPPSSLRTGLSPALDAVVLRAMARTPEERFSSAAEMLAALRAAAPQDSSPRALASALARLFGAEQEARAREVERLLALATPEEEQESTQTEVFAARAGLGELTRTRARVPGRKPAREEGEELEPTELRTQAAPSMPGVPLVDPTRVAPLAEPTRVAVTRVVGAVDPSLEPPVSRASSKATLLVGGLLIAALALGLTLGVGLKEKGRGPASERVSTAAATARTADPQVAPRAPSVEGIGAPGALPRVVEAPREGVAKAAERPVAPPRAQRVEPSPVREGALAPPAEARPEAREIEAPSPEERRVSATALQERATRLRGTLDADDARKQTLNRFLARLSLVRAAGDSARAQEQLAALAAELERLERGPDVP